MARKQLNNEVWLSLVERYVRDVEVASSNLVTSTTGSAGAQISGVVTAVFCLSHDGEVSL